MNIPESAVEAAAKALVMERSNGCCGVDWPKVCDDCDCFRDTSPDPFYYERKHAEAVLAAAVPLLCQPLQDEIDRLRAAIRDQAERWRNYQPGGFYPEASAYANAIENCGDALIDLLDELAAVQVGTGNSAELAQQ